MEQERREPQSSNWKLVYDAVERDDDAEVERLLGNTSELKYRDKNGNSLLHISAYTGNMKLTKKCIEHGIKLNGINNLGETPLMLASESNHLDVVKLLIEFGATVNCKRLDGRTPLHFAMVSENPAIINLLIDCDSSIMNSMDRRGLTALHLAVSRKSYEVVELLISRGIDVNQGLNGNTALRLAVKHNDARMTERILDAGATNVHFEFIKGATLLHLAIWMKSTAITGHVLDKGVDISATDNDGFTALHEAVIADDCDQVALLVDRGADVDAKTNDQNTPLHWAAIRKEPGNSQAIMKLLLSRNSKVNERNYKGSTPLHFVVKRGTVEDIKLLAAFGADFSIQNYFGESVVHSAAANEDPDLCRHLLHDYKLNVNKRCILGLSPLHIAARCGNADVATELIKRGAQVDLNCIGDKTPLYYAVRHRRAQVVSVLLENGADINSGTEERNMMLKIAVERRSKAAARIMVKSLARQEARGMAINPLNFKLIEQKEDLLELLEKCRAELRVMKEKKVFNCISFYHILDGRPQAILGYVRNKELIKNFEDHSEEFPIYEHALRSKINFGLRREKFQQCVSSMLCSVLPWNDPQHLIIQNVLKWLDEDDLPDWERYEET